MSAANGFICRATDNGVIFSELPGDEPFLCDLSLVVSSSTTMHFREAFHVTVGFGVPPLSETLAAVGKELLEAQALLAQVSPRALAKAKRKVKR